MGGNVRQPCGRRLVRWDGHQGAIPCPGMLCSPTYGKYIANTWGLGRIAIGNPLAASDPGTLLPCFGER